MQRCKYFDALGLKPEEYGTNFIADNDFRSGQWAQEREQYGFDSRETWNLDRTFIEWIYSRVMMYKEVTKIDMNFYRVPYHDGEITVGAAVDEILRLAREILTGEENDEQIMLDNSREICDLWKEVLPHMWW